MYWQHCTWSGSRVRTRLGCPALKTSAWILPLSRGGNTAQESPSKESSSVSSAPLRSSKASSKCSHCGSSPCFALCLEASWLSGFCHSTQGEQHANPQHRQQPMLWHALPIHMGISDSAWHSLARHNTGSSLKAKSISLQWLRLPRFAAGTYLNPEGKEHSS